MHKCFPFTHTGIQFTDRTIEMYLRRKICLLNIPKAKNMESKYSAACYIERNVYPVGNCEISMVLVILLPSELCVFSYENMLSTDEDVVSSFLFISPHLLSLSPCLPILCHFVIAWRRNCYSVASWNQIFNNWNNVILWALECIITMNILWMSSNIMTLPIKIKRSDSRNFRSKTAIWRHITFSSEWRKKGQRTRGREKGKETRAHHDFYMSVLVLRHFYSLSLSFIHFVKIPPIKVYSNVSIKDLSTWIFSSHCVELCPGSIEMWYYVLLVCLISWFVLGSYLLSHYFCHLDACCTLNATLAPSFPIWFSIMRPMCVCVCINVLAKAHIAKVTRIAKTLCVSVANACEIRIQFRS